MAKPSSANRDDIEGGKVSILNTRATMASIASKILSLIPAAASLFHIKGSTQMMVTLASLSIYRDGPTRHIPGGKPGRGTGAYKRKAAKRRAQIRARRLGHAK